MSQQPPSEKIRLVVADDHRLFREGLASLLERAPDLELVGEAGTGEEAIGVVRALMPDVVLMDLQMPGLSGIEATRAIARENPLVGVIVLTMFQDDESVFAAVRAGARGYVLKDADRGTLLRAIRAVAGGEALLDAAVAQRVLQQLAAELTAPRPTVPPGLEELTPRELEVLRLIAAGRRNREIAEELVISEKTVGNHVSNIFSKLRVADRVQAVIRARDAGLR